MRDEVFYAATKILAASVTGSKGQGLHKSPELVAESVDLAEQLVAEFEKRKAASRAELPPLPEPIGADIPPPAAKVPPAKK